MLVGVSYGSYVTFMINKPSRHNVIFSPVATVYIYPYLVMQISPPGYPTVGESWILSVFKVDVTDSGDRAIFQPALNSTVVITLNSDGSVKTFELPVDEKGKASFQFFPEYSDIAFQAYSPGIPPSEKIILRQHYVSFNEIRELLTFSTVIFICSLLGSGWLIHEGKVGKWQRWILILFIILFSVVTIISIYSRLFQGTTWGYPEKIIGDLITFTRLKLISFSGVISFVFFLIISLAIAEIRKSEKMEL